PRPEPNSNKSVFKSINAYLKDLEQDVVDLACDMTIFARTKMYKNNNLA
ncbi:7931_t:CDS:1, partial [Dentiscutata heterogama]